MAQLVLGIVHIVPYIQRYLEQYYGVAKIIGSILLMNLTPEAKLSIFPPMEMLLLDGWKPVTAEKPLFVGLLLQILEPPQGYTNSTSLALSADGSTVVGFVYNQDFQQGHLFRWTETGVEILSSLPISYLQNRAISSDGSVIVFSVGHALYRWTLNESHW